MSGHLGKNVTIVLALIAAGFVAAWLRFRPYLGSEGRYSDGVHTYDVAEDGAVRYAVWDAPVPLGGDSDGAEGEERPTVSPDGRTLVFTVGEPGLGRDLYVADLVDGRPRDPRPLAILNSDGDDCAPAFAGDALVFASDRLGTLGGLDLYRAPYADGVFGEPRRLEGGINSTADDTDPAAVPGSPAIAFVSRRAGAVPAHFDLYLATPASGSGEWSVVALEALNSGYDEREPAFTADGRHVFFASDRVGGRGGFDLYRSSLGAEGWVAPVPLLGLNTARAERGPAPSPDGFELLLATQDEDGAVSHLSRARSLELFRVPGRPVGWRELLVLGLLLLLALLAWLAKRWEELEVLYKCLLISLVIHGLLLWWFREVYPENEALPLRGRGDRIRVRAVFDPRADLAANSERGGDLEVARAEALEDASVLERATSEPAAGAPASAPAVARFEPRGATEATAPERAGTEAGRAAAPSPAAPSVALQTAAEAFERRSGEAAPLAVAARAAEAPAPRGAAESVERATASPGDPASVAAPSTAQVARATEAQPDAGAPGRAEVSLERSEAAAAVADATPLRVSTEAFERRAGEAAPLSLTAPVAQGPAARGTAAGIERAAPANVGTAGGAELAAEPSTARVARATEGGGEADAAVPARGAASVERSAAPDLVADATELRSSAEVFERSADRAPELGLPVAQAGRPEERTRSEEVPAPRATLPAPSAQGDERAIPTAPRLAREEARASRAVEAGPAATDAREAVARADRASGTAVALRDAEPSTPRASGEVAPAPLPVGEAAAWEVPGGRASGGPTRAPSHLADARRGASAEEPTPAAHARAPLARENREPELARSAAALPRPEPGPVGTRLVELEDRSRDEPGRGDVGGGLPTEVEAPTLALADARTFERTGGAGSAPGRRAASTERAETAAPAGPSPARASAAHARPAPDEAAAPAAATSVLAPARALPTVALAQEMPEDERQRSDAGRSDAGMPRGLSVEPLDVGPQAVAAAREVPTGPVRRAHGPSADAPLRAAPERRALALPPPAAESALADATPRERAWQHTPYQSRAGAEKLRALELFGGTDETEAAVAAGLAYLARIQSPEGFWGSADDRHEKYRHVAIGKTGLCLLAFLGAGHTPASDTEHSARAARAVDFLLAVQDPRTGHFGDCSSYGHGIATYALGECYALTREERLRAPLERAVARILSQQVRSRDPQTDGGWGYYYPDGAVFDRWPRASITAWQVMALESARLGGIEVPDDAFAAARGFLRRAWDPERGAFRYSHDPSRLSGEYAVLPGSTPASLFALSLLGDDVAADAFRQARRFVEERAPRRFRRASSDDFVHRAAGNLYFWYYGTLALFRVGGDPWNRWNTAMQETLVPAQAEDGSWPPISTYALDYAGDDDADRSYTTAMCVLTLEIYYRYFTPLLKVQ